MQPTKQCGSGLSGRSFGSTAAFLLLLAASRTPAVAASSDTAVHAAAGASAALAKSITAVPALLSAVLSAARYSGGAAAFGSAAGACPLGGQVVNDCAGEEPFVLTSTLDHCILETRQGSLAHAGQMTLRGSGGCPANILSGELQVSIDVTSTFAAPGGSTQLTTRAALSGTLTPEVSAGSCLVHAATLHLSGTIRAEVPDGGYVVLDLSNTQVVLSVSLFNDACTPVIYSLRFSGPASLEQANRSDPIPLVFDDFTVVVNMAERAIGLSGRLTSACFNGDVELDTLQSLVAELADFCPLGGQLLVQSIERPASIQYGAGGRVAIDEDNDGHADTSFASCRDPALLVCAARTCSGPYADVAAVIDDIFGDELQCDLSDDGRVSAADIVEFVRRAELVSTPTPTITGNATQTTTGTAAATPSPTSPEATQTPTPATPSPTSPEETQTTTPATPSPTSPEATPTRTAPAVPSPTATQSAGATETFTITPTVCSDQAARLVVDIDNRSDVDSITVALAGERLNGEAALGRATSYSIETTCGRDSPLACADICGLAPGVWRHSMSVIGPPTGQQQHQTSIVVADIRPARVRFQVFASVVTVSAAADSGTGTLRSALQNAPLMPKPLLIQFDPEIFPAGTSTAIELASQLPSLAADDVTIDGIDPNGAAGNRVIDAGGQAIAALVITGARNHVVGLRLRNVGGNNRDVLSISGVLAEGNLIEQVAVENAATADGIGIVEEAGTDFDDSVNVIRDCEVIGASDKGIKVTTRAHARVENTWVHDNVNGGIQATLGGHIQAYYNLVERNRGGSAQNGLVANAADESDDQPTDFSELITRGNISRENGANGLAVRDSAVGTVSDDYLAGNGSSGVRIYNDEGAPASGRVQGTSAVCNQNNGGIVADSSTADFGGGEFGSSGNNAFAWNALDGHGSNLSNSTSTGILIGAMNNQWEHCGFDIACDLDAIRAFDLHAPDQISYVPAQSERAGVAPTIGEVVPVRGRSGGLLRIFGSGFEAVYSGGAPDRCGDVASANTCEPLAGNCVRIGGTPATVEAVTPNMLVVRWPFTCSRPVRLEVVTEGAPQQSASTTICLNDAP